MKPSAVFALVGLVLLASCWCQNAEAIPPSVPGPDFETAPDIVEIRVLSVNKSFRLFSSNISIFRYNVELKCNVTRVQKAASGLEKGSRITIRYDGYIYNSSPVPGPGPNAYPILNKGHAYKAYLAPDGTKKGVYAPFGNQPNYTVPFRPKD